MCESTVYMIRDGKEEEVMEAVATIIPQGETLRLVNLFGEERVIKAAIKEIDLVGHKIILSSR